MDVSATSVLRTLTQSSPREEETELEIPSFAEFFDAPDHTMWFGDVIAQQQAALQNAVSDVETTSEPMTSVERAVRRDEPKDIEEREDTAPEEEVQVKSDDDREIDTVEQKVETADEKEIDDDQALVQDDFSKVEEVVDKEVEHYVAQAQSLDEVEVDDLAGAQLNVGQQEAVKSNRFAIHAEQAARMDTKTQKEVKVKADGPQIAQLADVDTSADKGPKNALLTEAKPVLDAKAPLTVQTPSRIGEFVAEDGEIQAKSKQMSAAALSQVKTAETTDADGEWLQMLQRNLPVDQMASRTQTLRTADTVQLGSNRVTAIAGPGLRVQGVNRPAATAAAQRATPMHRPQLPEGVDEMTLMRQISDGLKIRPGQDQTAEIRLRPADLGRVLIQLKMSGNEAKVVVTTENAVVGDALSNGLDQLRRDIMAQGVQVTQLEVRQEAGDQPGQQDQEQFLDDDGEEREGRKSGDDGQSPHRRKAKGRINVQA